MAIEGRGAGGGGPARTGPSRGGANPGAESRARAGKHAERKPVEKLKKNPGKKPPALREYREIPIEGKCVELGKGKYLARMNLWANIATDTFSRKYAFNRKAVPVDLVVEFSDQMRGMFARGRVPKFYAQTADGKRLVIPIGAGSRRQLAARLEDLLGEGDYRRRDLGLFNVIVETPEALIKARERRREQAASREI